MVPKPCGSTVPAAATALPITGGQYLAHEPLQRDLAGVSLANQYKVNPCALTSTAPLLVRIVLITTEPTRALARPAEDGAGLDVAGSVGLVLPQAASRTAAAARPGLTHHRLCMALSPFVWRGTSSVRSWPVPAALVEVPDDPFRPVLAHQAQQAGQAGQFGELIPAVSAARQVSADGTAVGGPD